MSFFQHWFEAVKTPSTNLGQIQTWKPWVFHGFSTGPSCQFRFAKRLASSAALVRGTRTRAAAVVVGSCGEVSRDARGDWVNTEGREGSRSHKFWGSIYVYFILVTKVCWPATWLKFVDHFQLNRPPPRRFIARSCRDGETCARDETWKL